MSWEQLPWNERVLRLDCFSDEEKGQAINLILELPQAAWEPAVPKVKAVAIACLRKRLDEAAGAVGGTSGGGGGGTNAYTGVPWYSRPLARKEDLRLFGLGGLVGLPAFTSDVTGCDQASSAQDAESKKTL